MEVFETNSAEETFAIGKKMAESAKAGELYCLTGDLGTGKTVFAQGFGAGLAIEEPISSPTFTVLKEYEEGRLPLYHFDVYRIGSPEEMEEIGLFDKLDGDGVCLIEWPELIEELLPRERITVLVEKDPDKGFAFRRITVKHEMCA